VLGVDEGQQVLLVALQRRDRVAVEVALGAGEQQQTCLAIGIGTLLVLP